MVIDNGEPQLTPENDNGGHKKARDHDTCYIPFEERVKKVEEACNKFVDLALKNPEFGKSFSEKLGTWAKTLGAMIGIMASNVEEIASSSLKVVFGEKIGGLLETILLDLNSDAVFKGLEECRRNFENHTTGGNGAAGGNVDIILMNIMDSLVSAKTEFLELLRQLSRKNGRFSTEPTLYI